MFTVAAETGWPEERILFMPLARLSQYQYCLLQRNWARTGWSTRTSANEGAKEQIEVLSTAIKLGKT